MVGLLIIGFVMCGIAVWFSYAEYMHWYNAVKEEMNRGGLFAAIRCIRHTGKLIPMAFDIGLAIFASTFLGMGSGIVGGVTGLFMSNCISGIIYYHTHIKNRNERVKIQYPILIKE